MTPFKLYVNQSDYDWMASVYGQEWAANHLMTFKTAPLPPVFNRDLQVKKIARIFDAIMCEGLNHDHSPDTSFKARRYRLKYRVIGFIQDKRYKLGCWIAGEDVSHDCY